MAKFKVIALSVGALGNQIFNSGDTVSDQNFPEGNAEELVKKGFLEPYEGDDSDLSTSDESGSALELTDDENNSGSKESDAEDSSSEDDQGKEDHSEANENKKNNKKNGKK